MRVGILFYLCRINLKLKEMKNLRVAVIPIGIVGLQIDQRSSYEEIVNCEHVELYPLTDFFQAQNDETLPKVYWSFLLDIEKEVDLNGSNIDGIHQHKKEALISQIKSIINEYGGFGVGEVEADCSPCVNEMGGLVALAESFGKDNVSIEVYEPSSFSSDSMESYNMDYTELSIEVLEEILKLAKQYEEQNKEED